MVVVCAVETSMPSLVPRAPLAADAETFAGYFSTVWPNTHPVFVTNSCVITTGQSEIQCAAPEGFGGPLQWSLYLLGVVAEPFVTTMQYQQPTLDALVVIQINSTTISNSTDVIVLTQTSYYSQASAVQAPVPRESGRCCATHDAMWLPPSISLARSHSCRAWCRLQSRTRQAASGHGWCTATTLPLRIRTT